MHRFSKIHKTLSFIISLSLIIQLFAPLFISNLTALPAPTTTLPAPTLTPTAPLQPDVLAQPLTLSRIQSAYHTADTINNTLTISFTVRNNQIAANFPDITNTGTATDTADILTNLDLLADRNTLHNVTLQDTLLSGVSYVDSTFPPNQSGSTLTWTLPDIIPGTEQLITLTVQVPSTSPSFTNLDSGAEVTAVLWDRNISHTTAPTTLAPDNVAAATTRATAAADSSDSDMLWRTAAFAGDPATIFSFVRDMQYEVYDGSLRGTRGTLWSEAGNSIDQSSLLIAILRANGIPARYRHGDLNTADAQALIASMFSDLQGLAGHIPPGTATADPINDPSLIALTQDHWWVEANLPSQGWTDLDPSFSDAAIGQSFATPSSNDRIAALPASVQHSLTLTLLVEQYTQFPVGGTFLQETAPLSATMPIAQVAGKQLVFGTFVSNETAGGAPFTSRTILYEPYFGIEENGVAFLGDAFQDYLTNFPLATVATTAVWLQYAVTAPDGTTETFQRTIKDSLGPDVRLSGGQPDIAIDLQGPSFLTPEEQYVNWVLPNDVPAWAYNQRVAGLVTTIKDLGEQTAAILEVGTNLGDEYTEEQVDTLVQAVGRFSLANTDSLGLTGLKFAHEADSAVHTIEDSTLTSMYYSHPPPLRRRHHYGRHHHLQSQRRFTLHHCQSHCRPRPIN